MFAVIFEVNPRPGRSSGWHRQARIIPDRGVFARAEAPQYRPPAPRP